MNLYTVYKSLKIKLETYAYQLATHNAHHGIKFITCDTVQNLDLKDWLPQFN